VRMLTAKYLAAAKIISLLALLPAAPYAYGADEKTKPCLESTLSPEDIFVCISLSSGRYNFA